MANFSDSEKSDIPEKATLWQTIIVIATTVACGAVPMILAIKQIPSEIVWRISELGAVGGFVGSILFFLVNLSDFKKLKMLHQAIRDATVHELNFFAVRIK